MNHITQRNRLFERLKLFKDFMPFCPNDKVYKLSLEINKILSRIEVINQMDFDEMVKEVHVDFETKQSKMNFYE